MAETSKLTLDNLEEKVSQEVINLYVTYLGHQVNKVSCHLVDKTLTIIIDDSITLPEQLLINTGQQDLAKKVRLHIEQAIEPRFKTLIEEVINIPVVDLLSKFTFDTGHTSIVAILASSDIASNLPEEFYADGEK